MCLDVKNKYAFPTFQRCKTALRPLNVIKSALTRPEIWFDDVDPKDIEAAIGPEAAKIARRNLGLETGQSKESVEQVLVKETAFEG